MNQFVFNQIKYYYEKDSRCEYVNCIENTLLKFEEGIFDLDLLFGDNPRENILINVFRSVFLEKLELEKDNETGVFGVRIGYFSDGVSWFYKDFLKSEFIRVDSIYAKSLDDLKDEIKIKGDLWYIFDKQKMRNIRLVHKPKFKRNKKISSKDVVRLIERNSLSDDFWKIKEEEKEKLKKSEDLEKELDLSEENRYPNLDKMYK